MRKLISFASLFSLVTPSFTYAYVAERSEVSEPKIKSYLPNCGGNSLLMILNQQAAENIGNLLNNIDCSNASNNLSEKLEDNYCKNVFKCQRMQSSMSTDLEKDKDLNAQKEFIVNEWTKYLMRENMNREMNNFISDDATNLKALLAYSDQLPDEYKNKINKCSSVADNTKNCMPTNSAWEPIALNFMNIKFKSHLVENTNIKRRSSNLNLNGTTYLIPDTLSSNYLTAGYLKTQSPNQQNLIGLEDTLSNISKINEEAKKNFLQNTNKLDPNQDEVLERLLHDIKEKDQNNILTADNLNHLIEHSLLNYSLNGKDPIFKTVRQSEQSIANFKNAMKSITFAASDFESGDQSSRQKLFGKINNLRVLLSNNYLQNNCGKVNLSVGQVCANVAKAFEGEQIVAEFNKNKKDLLKKMIASYEQSKEGDKNDNIAKLKSIDSVGNEVYLKYLTYRMGIDSCKSKYKGVSYLDSTGQTEALKQSIRVAESTFRSFEEQTNNQVAYNFRNNSTLQDEFKQYGITLNSDFGKSDLINHSNGNTINISTNNEALKSQAIRSDKIVSNDSAENNSGKFNRGANFSPVESYQNFSYLDEEARRAKNTEDMQSDLRTRLSDLEKREKALSKSKNQNFQDIKSFESLGPSDELQNLRQQIEDLKNQQSKSNSVKNNSDNEGIQKNSQSAKESEEARTQNRLVSAKIKTNSEGSFEEENNLPSRSTENNRDFENLPNAGPIAGNGASKFLPSTAGRIVAASAKGNQDKIEGGIVLSKSGELFIDPNKILDNPKEGEILNLLEQSKGLPFLIRENGFLVKVSAELDAFGKPQLTSNGKLRFKKIRLSKEQQETVVKEALNIQKAMKEVERDPTRLYNLRSLLNESVQRN